MRTRAFGELGSDLRFEAEAILFDLDVAEQIAAERLVASLHVGQAVAGNHVGERSQQPIAQSVQARWILMATAR